jgi:hypothetical protein
MSRNRAQDLREQPTLSPARRDSRNLIPAAEQPSLASPVYQSVLRAAQFFTVIPLEGKRPPRRFNYAKYRKQRPTRTELEGWFADVRVVAYGILCGQRTGQRWLIVLDHDDVAAYQRFAAQWPHLAQSYTVKTRRGYHTYLYVEGAAPIRSQKIHGGELLGQGALVVGAGSCVNEQVYQAINPEAPMVTISAAEFTQLLSSIGGAVTPRTKQAATTTANKPLTAETCAKLVRQYRELAPTLGRNNALYRVASQAAQHGISQQDIRETLLLPHIQQETTNHAHPLETAIQRAREAHATITSAYKRPAQQDLVTMGKKPLIGLPNALREAFLQQQPTSIVPRLLDAAALAGWLPGQTVTTAEIIAMAHRYGIGQDSVNKALTGEFSQLNGQPIFPKVTTHPHKPPVGDGDNPIKNLPRGRKPNYYLIPAPAHLCAICQISLADLQTTDALSGADLSSGRAYRQALHRELVGRTTPELGNETYAHRLHTSTRSIQRYAAALKLIKTPVIAYERLTWALLDEATAWGPVRENQAGRAITPGRWLQTADGQRYPAIVGLAAKLLAQHTPVLYCERRPSRLQLPNAPWPPVSPSIWRDRRGLQPDWGGEERTWPPQLAPTVPRVGAARPIQSIVPSSESLPVVPDDDLMVIKGIGPGRAATLRRGGIRTWAALAAADPQRLVDLNPLDAYLTAAQIQFWRIQADALARGRVGAAELASWSYQDWRACQWESRRIASASSILQTKLVQEFRAKGWLKYQPDAPDWFVQQVAAPQQFVLL